MIEVRAAVAADAETLSRIWFDGWTDAHLAILPAEIARHRTLLSFRERTAAALSRFRVVGLIGEPLGFVLIHEDEISQLYVSPETRGSGAAAALIAEAERCFARRQVEIAWLACAIGNDRAARFYEKSGWRRDGSTMILVDLGPVDYPLEIWRYEKRIPSASGTRAGRSAKDTVWR